MYTFFNLVFLKLVKICIFLCNFSLESFCFTIFLKVIVVTKMKSIKCTQKLPASEGILKMLGKWYLDKVNLGRVYYHNWGIKESHEPLISYGCKACLMVGDIRFFEIQIGIYSISIWCILYSCSRYIYLWSKSDRTYSKWSWRFVPYNLLVMSCSNMEPRSHFTFSYSTRIGISIMAISVTLLGFVPLVKTMLK